MTTSYDPNQKRGGIANAGNWTKYENSDPEAALAASVPGLTISTADLDWWKGIAEDETTPVELLVQLARSGRPELAEAAGGNETLPLPVLAELSRHESAAVRQRVGYNRTTDADTLAVLGTDDDYDVQAAVAANPITPAPTLAHLYKAGIANIAVAENPGIDEATHELALTDADPVIRRYALENKLATAAHVARASHDAEPTVRAGAARHRLLDGESALHLSKDPSAPIRRVLGANRATPKPIRLILAGDIDPRVAEVTRRFLGVDYSN